MGKRTIGLGVALAAGVALAGCGGSGVPPATTDAPTPPVIPQTPQLPQAPRSQAPQRTPNSPPAPFVRGAGDPIGATVRLDYTADSSSAIPPGFVPGGIPVGSHAGACTVPRPSATDRAQLRAAALRQTPGRIAPLRDDEILLADCGSEGYWAMITWTVVNRRHRSSTYVDEERFDGGGHWTGTATGVQPGCRMPLDAASAWQIDVSVCGNSRRGGGTPRQLPPGTLSA